MRSRACISSRKAIRKLTASESYRRLNEEIGYAEGSVAIERRKYNDLLEHYNAQLQRFPANVVAGP